MADIDWKTEAEYSVEDMIVVNGHNLGFSFYRGYDVNRPESPKTLRLVVMDKDIHGKTRPYRFKDFDTQKAKNLQLVLPDSLPLCEAMGKFLLDAVKNAKEEMKAKLEAAKAEAREAGI